MMNQRALTGAKPSSPLLSASRGVLQRAAVNSAPTNEASPIVRDVLNAPGKSWDASSALGEPAFGHDFSRVRAYADAHIEESSAAVGNLDDGQTNAEANHLNHETRPQRIFGRTLTTEHNRQRLSSTIRRVEKPAPATGELYAASRSTTKPTFPGILEVYRDAMPGQEQTAPIDFGAIATQSAQPVASLLEPREGETARLPDIFIDPTSDIEERDAVAGAVAYNPTVTQSGPLPSPFGATSPYAFRLSGITITPTASTYNVAATLDNPIIFQVTSGGKADVASETDPDITQANYMTVASDLTPDTSDLNGRPPRTQFWAEDLCIRHERFHASDGIGHSRSGVTLAQNWLSGQTAESVAEVNVFLAQVPARVAATRRAAMLFPGREDRAYGDGAPLYLARANAIKAKGDANGYATIPAPVIGGP